MKYDLYITNESRLSSPNANMVFKLGVCSVLLTLFLTCVTWLEYNRYVYDVERVKSSVEQSCEVVIQNSPQKVILFKTRWVKQALRGLHWLLLLMSLYYYYKAAHRNESSLWVAWGMVLIGCSLYHSYSIGEFWSIEHGLIDDIVRRSENRINTL